MVPRSSKYIVAYLGSFFLEKLWLKIVVMYTVCTVPYETNVYDVMKKYSNLNISYWTPTCWRALTSWNDQTKLEKVPMKYTLILILTDFLKFDLSKRFYNSILFLDDV